LRGYIRHRGEERAGSWEYIVDTGMARAQRCTVCMRPDSLLGAMYVTLAEEFTKEEWPRKVCKVCGKALEPGRSGKETCSGACRQRLSRKKREQAS
jgi:hypothetical protein